MTKCPICNAELQGTKRLYVSGGRLEAKTTGGFELVGYEVVDEVEVGELYEDIYCANDHALVDMLDAKEAGEWA